MGGIFSAYLITLGVITYRWYSGPNQPPPPIAFLGASVVFGMSGLLAQADERFGNVVAWGFLAGALVAPKSQIQAVRRLTGNPDDDTDGGHIAGSAPPLQDNTLPVLPPGQTLNPKYYGNPDAPNYDPFKNNPLTGA